MPGEFIFPKHSNEGKLTSQQEWPTRNNVCVLEPATIVVFEEGLTVDATTIFDDSWIFDRTDNEDENELLRRCSG